jgi:hypothetical protein
MSELQYHVLWCRQMYLMMAPGGIWGVPRSGLLFQKTTEDIGPKLVLTQVMPWTKEMMPITAEQLLEQQRGDFETIRDHFRLAGILVHDENGFFKK